MNEKLKDRKQNSSPFRGVGFLRIPRQTLGLLFAGTEHKRMLGLVYLGVALRAFHTEGKVQTNGMVYVCGRGEFVGTQEELSKMVGISHNTLRKYIVRLCEMGLLNVEKLHHGSRIRVIHYEYLNGTHFASSQQEMTETASGTYSLSEAESEWMPGGRSFEMNELKALQKGGRE